MFDDGGSGGAGGETAHAAAGPGAGPAGWPVRASDVVRQEVLAAEEQFPWPAAQQRRLDAVAEAEVLAAQAFLAQLDALLHVQDEHDRDQGLWGVDPRDDPVAEEVAWGSHLTAWAVARRSEQALAVRAFPFLRDLLLAGRLGVPHLVAAVAETVTYGEELTGRVLHEVLLMGEEPGWEETPPKLVLALRRCALRLDPEGCARRRAEREAQATGVRLQALRDGLAKLSATGNAVSVRAAHTLLSHLARPTGPDDERTAGQRQLDALCAALVTAAGGGVPFEVQLAVPVHAAGPAAAPPAGAPAVDPVSVLSDLTPELLALLAGSTPRPAPEPPGDDVPAPTEPDRRSADRAAAARTQAERAEAEQLVSAEGEAEGTGRPVDADDLRDQPDRSGNALDAESDPAVPDPARDGLGDPHRRPPGQTARRRQRAGVDEVAGVGPVDPSVLRELLSHHSRDHGLPAGLSGITVRRLCVDPTGQVIAVDPVAVPLDRLLAAAAEGAPPGAGRRRRGPAPSAVDPERLLRALVTALPGVPPDTAAYEPTAAQRRVVRARDRHCTFPGCLRPARGCDLDHREPYPQGATSVDNLHPLCEHHHHLKHRGWRLRRRADGSTTWTSPAGQRRTVRLE